MLLGVCGPIAAVLFLMGERGSALNNLFYATVLIVLAAAFGVGYAGMWMRVSWRWVAIIGSVSLAIALGLTLAQMGLSEFAPFSYLGTFRCQRLVMYAWIVAATAAHICFLGHARLKVKWIPFRRWTCICLVGLAAVLIHEASQFMIVRPKDPLIPSLSPGLLVVICTGTVLVAILHAFSGLNRREFVAPDLLVSITCPRCLLTQGLPMGRTACANCELGLSINIEVGKPPSVGARFLSPLAS